MWRDEQGNTLILVILVSMIVGMLAALTLATGQQADVSSASDRNHEQALGVSEAGVNQQISRIEGQLASSFGQQGAQFPIFTPTPGSNPQGSFQVQSTHCPPDPADPAFSTHQSWCNSMAVTNGYVIDATGGTGGDALHRARHVRVSLVPPQIFPNGGYALFSYDTITLKNNDTINQGATVPGNVFANNSIQLNNNVIINGSVTSAQSWIDTTTATVAGNVWSGGYNSTGHWALNLGNVGGFARASVTAPTDPQTCGGQDPSNYTVQGGPVAGDVTTWGTTVTAQASSTHTGVCTAATPLQPMPTFIWNPNNYNQSTLHQFSSVSAFNSWVSQNQNQLSSIQGTFYIPAGPGETPSQANRVDLSGWNLGGDLTIVTDFPIYTGGITDNNLPNGVRPLLTLVSHYHPATSTDCDYNHDDSDCSIHAKNSLQTSCVTAVLLYADKGPVAVKNNSNFCGSVQSDGIIVKNNQTLLYDPRANQDIGFGSISLVTGRWEELPS